MLKFYFNLSPNPSKVALLLEELGLDYDPVPVDPRRGQQFEPAFLAVNPNGKVPAIVDGEVTVFDSNAILLYLAEKTGRFIPADVHGRAEVLQWLFWQMGGLGPMAGQAHHFRRYAPAGNDYAVDRYTRECARLYRVLDTRLSGRSWIAGDYSIADMATFPWVSRFEWHQTKLEDHPNVHRWFKAIGARAAVQKGMSVPG